MASRTLLLTSTSDDRQHQVDVIDDSARLAARIEERVYEATRSGPGVVRITAERTTTAWSVISGDVRWVFVGGRVYELAEARPRERNRSAGPGSLTAPMPATVLRVFVKPGDVVGRGDTLLILEAMKMELPVRAGDAGTIRAVHCREGELVQPGLPLIEMDAP